MSSLPSALTLLCSFGTLLFNGVHVSILSCGLSLDLVHVHKKRDCLKSPVFFLFEFDLKGESGRCRSLFGEDLMSRVQVCPFIQAFDKFMMTCGPFFLWLFMYKVSHRVGLFYPILHEFRRVLYMPSRIMSSSLISLVPFVALISLLHA